MAPDDPVGADDGRMQLVRLLNAYNFPLTPEVINLIGLMDSKTATEFETLLRIRILTHQMTDALKAVLGDVEATENSTDQIESSGEEPLSNVLPFRDPLLV